MDDDLHVPDTLVLDLAPVLRQWIGWFTPEDDENGHLYHSRRGGEFWNAHAGPHYRWIGCHPNSPRWVKEVVRAVAPSGDIDVYRSLFLSELVSLLSRTDAANDLENLLRRYVNSPSPLLDEEEELNQWLCSSDARGDYLLRVTAKNRDGQAGLASLLREAQALERRTVAERLLMGLTSDEGQFPIWLHVEFEGLADCTACGTEILRVAGRLISDLGHEDLCRLVRTYKKSGLFRLPYPVHEGLRVSSDDRMIENRVERALARAAIALDLFGEDVST